MKKSIFTLLLMFLFFSCGRRAALEVNINSTDTIPIEEVIEEEVVEEEVVEKQYPTSTGYHGKDLISLVKEAEESGMIYGEYNAQQGLTRVDYVWICPDIPSSNYHTYYNCKELILNCGCDKYGQDLLPREVILDDNLKRHRSPCPVCGGKPGGGAAP